MRFVCICHVTQKSNHELSKKTVYKLFKMAKDYTSKSKN